jgi:hypothetical protein
VHDNFVYAYFVDCEQQRIVLHTSYRDKEPIEFTDVVFNGVLAHSFEHVLPGNILLDVREVSIETMVQEYAESFRESWRWGWPPIDYKGDLDVLQNRLHETSIRAYDIDSSYGLAGWVLALNCERVIRDAAFRAS